MRIALVGASFLLLCGVAVCAESPSTQNYKKPDPPKQQATTVHSNPSPSPVIGNTAALSLEKKSEENQKHWYDELDKNRFLLFIGLLQLGVFGLQARRLRQTIEVTDKAAEAAQKSADFAEKSLTLIERPYVFAHSVSKFHISENLNPAITYEVANFGKTPAIIQSAHVALENIKSNLGAALEVDRRHTLVSAPILSAGEVRKNVEEEIPANMVKFNTTDKGYAPDLKHGEDLFLRVIIHYRGPFTEGHESSFCWRYNTHTNYFEPYGHDNYNYTK